MTKEELTELDRAVAEALGWKLLAEPAPRHWACDSLLAHINPDGDYVCPDCQGIPSYSTSPTQWAELLERFKISLHYSDDTDLWCSNWGEYIPTEEYGPTPGIAVCRAVVALHKESEG